MEEIIKVIRNAGFINSGLGGYRPEGGIDSFIPGAALRRKGVEGKVEIISSRKLGISETHYTLTYKNEFRTGTRPTAIKPDELAAILTFK